MFYDNKKMQIKSDSFLQIINERNGYYKIDNYYLYVDNNRLYFNNKCLNKLKMNINFNMFNIIKKKNVFLTIMLSKIYGKKKTVVIVKKCNKEVIEKYLKKNNVNDYVLLYKDDLKRNIKTKLLILKNKSIYEDNLDSNPINIFGRSKLYYINAVKGNYYAFISKNEDKSRYNKIKLFNKNTKCIQIEK